MEKPIVNIVEHQYETTNPTSVSKSEELALLIKYGLVSNSENNNLNQNQEVGGLTFEEMVALEESKRSPRPNQRPNIQTYSIDRNNVNYYSTSHTTIDGNGSSYGFEIQIVSDMKINQ